ncbi:MAG: prepilin-type N-terminal cleavage/methylation domain-containing protein [Kiritimatiellae bacterium]|nr:prepilin-type N-terminal cleavage/methylation domain-containing protein [Kiritimatiellia bacterium]
MRSSFGAKSGRSAFTMIEMMAVVGILAMLMAILFPAVQKARERAMDVAARDMVSQVAAAWTILATENHRFPSKALIEWAWQNDNGGSSVSDGTPFSMTPTVGCVLNWWYGVRPVASADLKAFTSDKKTMPRYASSGATGPQKDETVSFSAAKMFDYADHWPPDVRLERSAEQKRIGLYAPWVERALRRKLAEDDQDHLVGKELYETMRKDFKAMKLDRGLVKVMLDFDGDGEIKVPGEYTETGEDQVVRAAAVAFVQNEKGTKYIRSW